MTKCAVFCLLLGPFNALVIGENLHATSTQEPKDSSVFMLIYNFMSEVNALKSEFRDLKYGISDNTDETDKLSKDLQDLAKENEELKSRINEQKDKNELLEAKLLDLETSEKRKKESGATYVRWGRTECPNVDGTVKIYDGYAAGDHYKHGGGGVELLCLPKKPSWGNYGNAVIGHAYVYGTEMEIADANSNRLFGKPMLSQNLPCVLCQSVGRPAAVRIPGRRSCYSGWTEEYRGYLFAGHHRHAKSTDYTCVDSRPESVPGKQYDEDGRLLYPVEASCHPASLMCPPYVHGREIACVICTK